MIILSLPKNGHFYFEFWIGELQARYNHFNKKTLNFLKEFFKRENTLKEVITA